MKKVFDKSKSLGQQEKQIEAETKQNKTKNQPRTDWAHMGITVYPS